MLNRAYSVLTIKAVDDDARTIEGIATTPEPDRLGDIVEPKGAEFRLPIPLLWQHSSREPIGHVIQATVKADGIYIKAQFAQIAEAGALKDRLDEAWQSVKSGLVRGLSIGFNSIESSRIDQTYAYRFIKWMWLELSVVTIPANQDATITAVKSFDQAALLASSGMGAGAIPKATPAVAGTLSTRSGARRSPMKKSIPDQIKEFGALREEKKTARNALMEAAAETGTTLTPAQREEYDGLDAEVKSLDEHIARLEQLAEENKAAAVEVKGQTADEGARSRDPRAAHVIQLKQQLPPGIGFARAVMCKMAGYMDHRNPLEIAKERYPSDDRLHRYMKAAVVSGTTTDTNWATELVEPTTLSSEFIEYLRAMTIIGKFGTTQGGVTYPSLRRLPFNIRIPRQTTGGTGYWVGEGLPKPLTRFNFDAVTMAYTKVACIAVITKELARFSSPSAEVIVRDQLAAAVVERIDTDLIDPAKAVSSGVNPASLTNGLTALSSAGTSAANVQTDVQNLLEAFILANVNPASVVLIMPNTLALALSVMLTANGVRQYPDISMNGGSLLGIPVITSQYAASGASYGNMVIAVNANDVGLADDGTVDISVSGEASLQMDDAPSNSAVTGTGQSLVSMFQTNSLAILAERYINWVKLRSSAVVFMDDVNWGAIGSPF